MHGISSRRLASITGAALLIVGLLPGPGLLAASVASAVGPGWHLVFTQQPSNTTVGVDISPAVTVTIEDTGGTTVDTSSTVAIAIGSGSGGLHGSVSVTASHGVATFSTLYIDTAGNNFTLTATDAADGGLTVNSNAFNITTPAVVNHLAFGTLPAPTPVGATLSPVTVILEDSSNSPVTTATGSVYVVIGSGPGGAQLLGSHTATVVNGVATFSGLSITVPGSYTLIAAYGALQVTSGTITITTTNHLVFWTQPVGGAAGAVWPNFQVAVEYPTNTVVTTDNSTVSISIATNPAGGTLSCTGGMSEVAVNGYAYFSGCSINLASASSYTLYATSSAAWTPATSNAFYVTGTRPALAISASSALGLNPTSGYTSSTPKYATVGKYVTWEFIGGTALAGQRVNVMVATRVGGVWGLPKYLKSAWANSSGIVTFARSLSSAGAINVRIQWPGNTTYGVSTSKALGAYWK